MTGLPRRVRRYQRGCSKTAVCSDAILSAVLQLRVGSPITVTRGDVTAHVLLWRDFMTERSFLGEIRIASEVVSILVSGHSGRARFCGSFSCCGDRSIP